MSINVKNVTSNSLFDHRTVEVGGNAETQYKVNRWHAVSSAISMLKKGLEPEVQILVNGEWVTDTEGMDQLERRANQESEKPGRSKSVKQITAKNHLSNLGMATKALATKDSISQDHKRAFLLSVASTMSALDLDASDLEAAMYEVNAQ